MLEQYERIEADVRIAETGAVGYPIGRRQIAQGRSRAFRGFFIKGFREHDNWPLWAALNRE